MQSDILPHIAQLRAALQHEYEYEKAYFRQQTERMGVARQVRRGECWFPLLTGAAGHNALGQLTLEVQRTEMTDIEPAFEYGSPITFFREELGGKLRYWPWNGQVSYVDGNRMVVTIPHSSALADVANQTKLGIQLSFNERTYQLEFEALKALEKAEDKKLAHLRDVLLGNVQPSFGAQLNLRFPWLNSSQQAAVNHVLAAKDVAIVHGPPGTGKTTTLVEAIYETLRRENQVLVCAQSNAAVDWIAEQLTDRGLAVLRIGNPSRVTDKMLGCTYERQFADHAAYPELWNVRKALRSRHTHEERDNLRERAAALELQIRTDLFATTRIVAATLTGAGSPLLNGQHFHSLFIDEAAQATEPACWIALRKADRTVLAGDHCQLPPTLRSPEGMYGPLARTLMERITEQKPSCVKLLTLQYRMHPDIMQFSSDFFYGGALSAAPCVQQRGVFDLDSAMLWFDTAGCQWFETENDNYSRENPAEAAFLIAQLEAYADAMSTERLLDAHCTFGVISPYQGQIRLLRKLLKQSERLRPLRKHISVQTVDGFQGQERDVILLSLVRANENGQIGFLSDLRRMNVALTRARYKVMIVGDADTLGRHKFYRQLLEHIAHVGRIIKINETTDSET